MISCNRTLYLFWLLVLTLLAGAFASFAPTRPADFWWHLKIGEIIATSGIPQTNLFAWTLPADQPYVYQSWLGEWLFYQLYALGGLPLIVITRNLLITLAFGLVALHAYRRSTSLQWTTVTLVILAAMISNNLFTRPQNWAWVPFTLFLLLLFEITQKGSPIFVLWLCPVLMLFWVNVHGSFVVGLLVLLAYGVGELAETFLRPAQALPSARLVQLGGVILATFCVTLLNPQGLGIVTYLQNLLSNTAVQELIYEWQPPRLGTLAGSVFYATLVFCAVLILRYWQRLRISEILLLIGLGSMGAQSLRSVIWFGMAALPIMVSLLVPNSSPTRMPMQRGKRRTVNSHKRNSQSSAGGRVSSLQRPQYIWSCFAVAVGLYLAVQPGIYPMLPLPEWVRSQRVDLPGAPQLASRSTPVAAIEHLRIQSCPGQIFNDSGAGSYMIWALGPQTQVFIDPRIELFSETLWNDYLTIASGRDLGNLLDRKYRITCILLDREMQPALADVLSRSPGWVKTFPTAQDDSSLPSEVWRRQ